MCNEAQIKVMFSDWFHIVCNHVLFVCMFSLSHDFRLFCEQFICDIILYVIFLFLLCYITIREQQQLSARNSNRLNWIDFSGYRRWMELLLIVDIPIKNFFE